MTKEDAQAVAVAIRQLITEANGINEDLTIASVGVAPEVVVADAQERLTALATGLEAAAKSLEEKAGS